MDRAPREPTKGGEGKKKFRESFSDEVTQNLIFQFVTPKKEDQNKHMRKDEQRQSGKKMEREDSWAMVGHQKWKTEKEPMKELEN